MAEQKKTEGDATARREPDRTNRSQTGPDATRGAGSSNAAGTGNNPQDDKDVGEAGDSRPRGKTEDPDRTL